jgi:uncharacterized protein YoaH (UPF0181 family)
MQGPSQFFDSHHLYEGFTLPDHEEFDERVAILMADGMSEKDAKEAASAMIKKRHSIERRGWK